MMTFDDQSGAPAGFRLLDEFEVDLVGGGTIVVWGERPTYDTGGGAGGDSDGDGREDEQHEHEWEDSTERGGETRTQAEIDEALIDALADSIRDTINAAPNDGLERGAIIYRDANGNIVATPIMVGQPGSVNVQLPPGVSGSQMLAFVHSHPPAPRSGNPQQDTAYDNADRYPSPADWDHADAMVAGGANPGVLSFYVIDMLGALREYDYGDKNIYDVPEAQLLGLNGQTPPPLPDPIS
jgi:hypothetical protein